MLTKRLKIKWQALDATALRRWPMPALGAWLLCWVIYHALLHGGVPWSMGWTAACALGVVCARLTSTPWRRVCVAAGFPLSWALMGQFQGQGPLEAVGWLVPLAVLFSLYPLSAWSDAPLFPTPLNALNGLAQRAPLSPNAQVLDAGCGFGAGLRALSDQYPQAQLSGWEWSRPLAWLCAKRHPKVEVRQADMWRQDWSRFEMVYLFQRPETMPRAVRKAQNELKPGAYLVSLEFEAPGLKGLGRLDNVRGKPVWIYQMDALDCPAAQTPGT